MNRIILFLVSLTFSQCILAHDFQISLFEVGTDSEGYVNMFVRFDKEDILQELYKSCEDYGEVEKCVETYLNEHFSLLIEGREIYFQLSKLAHSENFVEVNFNSSHLISPVTQIELFNDVLMASKPSQENIVRFSLFDQNRSFRLNKDRTKTTVTYNQ